MPQDDPSTTPSTPLAALARRWKLAVALAVALAVVGALVAFVTPATYTGEARIAVGSESLDARVVAGYSEASERLASDVARYVTDQQAQDALDPLLGGAADGVDTVAASPIPDSSVVRVEVTADSRETARRGAQTVAEALTEQVNQVSGESAATLLQQYTDLSNQVSAAQQASDDARGQLASISAGGSGDEAQARAAVQQTAAALDVLEVQQTALGTRYRNAVTSTPAAAGLRIVQEGRVSGDDTTSRVQQYGLVGALAGLLLALLIAVRSDRRRTGTGRGRRAARSTADLTDGSTGGSTAVVDTDGTRVRTGPNGS